MSELDDLQRILVLIAEDVAAKGDSSDGRRSFCVYKECLEPLTRPYTENGFWDQEQTWPRFLSETATLHLAGEMIRQWCDVHGIGDIGDIWKVHPEARFFVWYHVSNPILSSIRDWASAHSDITGVLQATTLAAERSLAGLRRRALGEFFTPTEIAQHLVMLSGYDPVVALESRVVDPACGNGNLLAAIATKVVQAVKLGFLEPDVVLSSMNLSIYGFDVQPIAVLLTRLQLLLASLPILEKLGSPGSTVCELLSFPHIQLRDPLAKPEDFWDMFATFDIVLANPPFLKVPRSRLPFLQSYERILGGHVNLYQLFLWWAVKAVRSGGNVSFLVPQSMRSGQYSSKLRQQIADVCDLTAITCFTDRTGVFDSVDQQMMAVALKKSGSESVRSQVSIRTSANGQSLRRLGNLVLEREQVIQLRKGEPVWCISGEADDYAILSKVCEGQAVLGEDGRFKIVNGGFVWNQHKKLLRSTEEDNTLPLVSSASIDVHHFTFPPADKRVSQRLFVDATTPIAAPLYSSLSVLLKRTTPRRVTGRRVVATPVSGDFCTEYPQYLIENHVNAIVVDQEGATEVSLLSLCAWLNSRLANFVFSLMNGSAHLSKSELELIPAPRQLLTELEDLAWTLVSCSPQEWGDVLHQIDQCTFQFFELSMQEIARVKHAIPDVLENKGNG